MERVVKQFDVGVIVGRFQVPELHRAHKELIDTVCKWHNRVIILLGCAPANISREDPLDYESRVQMIRQHNPNILVFPVHDKYNDFTWSMQLDQVLTSVLPPGHSVILYGGRNSFIKHYTGVFSTQELISYEASTAGTDIRKDVATSSARASNDFRAGQIYATTNRFDICMPTVDIGIFDRDYKRLLLGKKHGEPRWRLPGGFADPDDESYEQTARREAQEETGYGITDPVYVRSTKVDDWRHKGKDKIKTILFRAFRFGGTPKAGDDLAEICWVDFPSIDETEIMPNHVKLIHMLEGSVG